MLSGMAMSVAGTSRPCSGACHEIIHAVDAALPRACPTTASSPASAPSSRASCAGTRRASTRSPAAARHEPPRTPAEIGLTDEQFVAAVLAAPDTRPDRYTILEHLGLDEEQTRTRVSDFLKHLG